MTACGSPLWTAPEVIRGEKYSEKADVYSFAIILYELLTWSHPYPKDNPHFVMMKVASEDYRMDIEDDWDDFFKCLVAKCWHPEPEQRPSFKDVVGMIDKCHRETSLMKLKGDWRDTLKTFRMKTMRKQNSIKKEKNQSIVSDGVGGVGKDEDEIAKLWSRAAIRRGSIETSSPPLNSHRFSDPVNLTSSIGVKARISRTRKKSIALQAMEVSEFHHAGVMPTICDGERKLEEQIGDPGNV